MKGGVNVWCFGERYNLWSWLNIVWVLVVGGGLATLVIWSINRFSKQESINTNSNALDLARERYAKGEITRDEFNQMQV